MIGTVTLARSPLTTSRLGFGTSRLHHMTPRARADILALAVDLGLCHIDTAPAYGDGLAERVVGEVLRCKRDAVVLATKAGLPPHPLSDRFPVLSSFVRAWRVAGRLTRMQQRRRVLITPAGVRASLEASLRRLRADHVDVLFLHEPSPDVIQDPDGVLDALMKMRCDGLARHVGVAGAWAGIEALGHRFISEPLLVQTHEDEWSDAHPPDFVYGLLSQGPQAFGAGGRVASDYARDRLVQAFSREARQAALVSTTDADHLRALAAVVHEMT